MKNFDQALVPAIKERNENALYVGVSQPKLMAIWDIWLAEY